jgi:hypothetical protein
LTHVHRDQFFPGIYHLAPANQIIDVMDWSGFLAARRVPRLKAAKRRWWTRPVLLAQHNREGKPIRDGGAC